MPEGLADGEDGVTEEKAVPVDCKTSEERSSKGTSTIESSSASGLTRRLSVARADPVDKVRLDRSLLHVGGTRTKITQT